MAYNPDWLDQAMDAYVRRVSGRTLAVTCLIFYPGLGLLLPLGLGVSRLWFVSLNFAGVVIAAGFCVSWMILKLDAKDRRHLLEWTTELRHLDASEFEYLVGALFEREGWEVRQTGSQSGPDGMIDVELSKGKERRLVQCKRWSAAYVGVNDVRAFAGSLLRENLRGSDGVFVTLSSFNDHAIKEGKAVGMELIDGPELFRRVEHARRPEPCPVCQAPMTLDHSQHGWWFRCTAAGCAGKRDLGREPATVVQLLTLDPAASAVADQ